MCLILDLLIRILRPIALGFASEEDVDNAINDFLGEAGCID